MHPLLQDGSFARYLLDWFEDHERPLPWKNLSDPYLIWISEIILQQTRAEQGRPYFERFREAFPTLKDLAETPEEQVLRLWQGLGYYSRARNLHATAKFLQSETHGVFPNDYASIRALRGVGDYTAAAITSFAFGLPYAVVDGNVHRVLARVFGIDAVPVSSQGKKQFASLAQQLLDAQRPADYNQAIMDFGAALCTPAKPACEACPFQTHCVAYQQNRIGELPAKKPRSLKRDRYFNFLLLEEGEHLLLEQRQGKDIWKGLFQLPLVETPEPLEQPKGLLPLAGLPEHGIDLAAATPIFTQRQTLSHQHIHAQVWHYRQTAVPGEVPAPYLRVPLTEVGQYALPRVLHTFFEHWMKQAGN
jgi:A/G-specific adenine glycosylase